MKTTIRIATVLAMLGGSITSSIAQVGIGTATPHASSILDLTNTGNKGLVLPESNAKPSNLTGTAEAIVYYYESGLYLKDSVSFNNLNSWKYKYNGSIVEAVSFNPSNVQGVGIGIDISKVLTYLHITAKGKDISQNGVSAAIMVGDSASGTLMLIDADEIMVRKGTNDGGTLKLQEEDGSVQIGSNRTENTEKTTIYLNTEIGSDSLNKHLTVHGNIDAHDGKIKESGYELIPRGTVIAFYGASVPNGWAPCDGSKYVLNASGVATPSATGIQTPDLRGRKIVGNGYYLNTPTDSTNYVYNTTGGRRTETLAITNLPNHQHSGYTEADGAHVHNANFSNVADNDDFDHYHPYIGDGDVGTHGHGAGTIRAGGSNHRHQLDLNGDVPNGYAAQKCEGCNATPVNIQAPYIVLRYIMKL